MKAHSIMNRIIDISYKNKSSHIGSSITTYPILKHIYENKKSNDICILSAGHGGLAHYVILEEYEHKNADELYQRHGVHPHRDVDNGIHVSSGSLGSAILVAVGYAMADPNRNVHVVISDGECGEGSVWEALNFSRRLNNLFIHVNINGYSAYDSVNVLSLCTRIKMFNYKRTFLWFTKCPDVEFMNGLKSHYHVMSESDKDKILYMINNETRFCRYSLWSYAKKFKNFFTHGGFRIWNFGFDKK